MAIKPDDVAEIVRSVLEEEERPVSEADIDAALADPALAAILARVLAPHEGKLTPKGLERMRRTVAVVFLRDPTAASLLTQVREGGDASRTVTNESAGVPVVATPQRRRRRRTP